MKQEKGKNIVIIFGGGVGKRMKCRIPKQFLEFRNIPIIIHTMMHFEKNSLIDEIYVIIKKGYEKKMEELVKQYDFKKVVKILPPINNKSGLDTVYTGLKAAKASETYSDNDIVLIHDAVRPMIDDKLIINNIKICREKGNCVTIGEIVEPPIILNQERKINQVLRRDETYLAKSPQTFFLKEILELHEKVRKEQGNYNKYHDNSAIMFDYGIKCNTVICSNNIKITTVDDYYQMIGLLNANDYKEMFINQN